MLQTLLWGEKGRPFHLVSSSSSLGTIDFTHVNTLLLMQGRPYYDPSFIEEKPELHGHHV